MEEVDQAPDASSAELELGLRERLRIEPLALEEEFIRCPSDIAYLAARYGHAVELLLRCKVFSKKIHGFILMEKRQELLDKGGKPTESQVEALTDQDERWIGAQYDEASAEREKVASKGNLDAMLAKKDCLVQLGATMRAEMERDPVIRDRRAVARGG